MTQKNGLSMCDWISWLIGIAAGVLAYWLSVGAVTWLPALLLAVAVAVFVGLVLSNLICGRRAAHGSHAATHASAGGKTHAHSALAEEALAEAETGAMDAGADAAGISHTQAAEAKAKVDAALAEEAAKAKAEEEAQAKAAEAAAAAAAAKAEAEAKAQAEAEAAAKAEAEAAAKAKAKADADAAAAAAAESTPDYDGDGVLEGENEGTRPEALDGPRGGKADNLKEIKGIGPKLEKLCNALGFYHFDQIAGWSADEVAWVNANLQGFKGRVSRDQWVEQAKILAAGGETEFSQRVEGGKVY